MTKSATIGHNQPPPLEMHSLHIEDLFSLVSGTIAAGPIATDEQEAALDELLDEVRKAAKAADVQRAAEKKPHDDAGKAVQAAWKPLIERCDKATAAIKDALTPYRTAKQRAKDEAARIAREKADAERVAAQEAMRASEDMEARFAAEEQLKAAEKLTAAANKIDRAPTGLRTYYTAEVTDRKAALLHYIARNWEPFEALIQTLADQDARGTRAPVPGVIFHKHEKAV